MTAVIHTEVKGRETGYIFRMNDSSTYYSVSRFQHLECGISMISEGFVLDVQTYNETVIFLFIFVCVMLQYKCNFECFCIQHYVGKRIYYLVLVGGLKANLQSTLF